MITALFVATTAWSASGSMSVQVRNADLRKSPSFLDKPLSSVTYGEQVQVLQQQGSWLEVSASEERRGWIHQSALTSKRVVFSSGATEAKPVAAGDEISLAGRGFNAHVEEEFKSENSDLDYTWVEWMEQIEISPREMVAFLREGSLDPKLGGAK